MKRPDDSPKPRWIALTHVADNAYMIDASGGLGVILGAPLPEETTLYGTISELLVARAEAGMKQPKILGCVLHRPLNEAQHILAGAIKWLPKHQSMLGMVTASFMPAESQRRCRVAEGTIESIIQRALAGRTDTPRVHAALEDTMLTVLGRELQNARKRLLDR